MPENRTTATGSLDERARSVLRAVIREYIRVGRPVGSRRLSRIYREGLSPASLRNVMADLEEAGFLTQPHTSAGRVPTAAGYRYYVEYLMGRGGLDPDEIGEIRRNLEAETDPEELMERTSRLLAAYSDNIGIVLAPPISRAIMKHIEFVRLSGRRILVILVSRSGLIQHRLVAAEEDYTQAELDQAGRYLVEHFAGRTLLQVRAELIRLVSQERAQYDRLLRNAIRLGFASLQEAVEEKEEEPQVFLGGASRVARRLVSEETDRLFMLLQALEEKRMLVKIVSDCIREGQSGPFVTIGLEQHIPGLVNWTLITSPYEYEGQSCGSLGILGPSRMEYERAISLVSWVARLFGQMTQRPWV
jgi:heat-inducible transcriptional repressor